MITDTVRVSLAFAISIMFAVIAPCGQTAADATNASVSEFATASEATSWSISTIDLVGDVGEFTSLGIDSNDKVHISYYDSTNGDLKYATNAGGMWVTCAIDRGKTVGWYTSLALDSNDKVHISYYDEAGGNLKYATNAGGSWATLTIDSIGDVGRQTSIAIDSSDKVHISYQDAKNMDLKYATNADGSWTTCTVDSDGWVGTRGTSIAVDSGNRVHISYMKLDPTLSLDLKYATYSESSWTISTIDRDYSKAGGYPSLALDSGGKVHISYGGGWANLKYATNLGSSWMTCELDSCPSPIWTSLAIDSCDGVHISYVDRNGGIGYATNAGGFWSLSTVDSEYGHGTSLAIDSCDRVHIGYLGGTRDLKYARNTEPPSVSLVIYNGTVITMEEDVPVAQALAIKDDRIVAVGSNEDILALAEAGTRVIDLRGRTVLPGFIDSHSHYFGGLDYASVGTSPYDKGQRWLPPWCFEDSSAKGVTYEDVIQATIEGGWTSVSELYADQYRLDTVSALDRAGELRLRVNAYLPLNNEFGLTGDWWTIYSPGQELSSNLRVAGVKLYTDSLWDYGQSVFISQEDLTRLAQEAQDKGFQVAIHAQNAGIDMTLDTFSVLGADTNALYRNRVEHLIILSDDQLDRTADLGVIASIQLAWFTSNTWETIYDVRRWIGFDRVDQIGRWHDIIAAGIRTIGGTDWPMFYGVNGSAMAMVYKAVTRIGEMAYCPAPQWVLDQRLTVEEALRLLTIDAAYGCLEEDVKGSIAVGKLADLVVLSENPLAIPPERLMDVSVLMTMIGGNVEYCAPGHEYLYGSVCSSPLATAYCWALSNSALPIPLEESAVATEAVTSIKENA